MIIPSFRYLVGVFVSVQVFFLQLGYSWGHLKKLNDPYLASLSLMNKVIKTNQVRYCVVIEPSKDSQSPFNAFSISAQTEMAIRVWLEPLKDLGVRGTRIQEVSCQDGSIDLKVEFRDCGEDGFSAHTFYELNRQNHFVPMITVNTAFKNKLGFRRFDHLQIAPKNEWGFRNSLRQAKLRKLDRFSFSQNQEWMTEEEKQKFSDVKLSSYSVLLHEMGHAFGLCDAYEPDVFQKCDSEYTSLDYPSSVMKSDRGYFYLTDDDSDGVKSLFYRFSGPSFQ